MASNAYGYTPEEMTQTGNTLISIKGEIGQQISSAQRAVSQLIESGFTTAAASGAYSQQFSQLYTALGQVNDALEPLGQFLISYADQVVNTDNQFSGMLQG
jgi:uncharacterized protein YukE